MPLKVLIIDDSPVILEAAKLALEDEGYQVVAMDNPLVLAAAVRRERPDLVLIDVNMPTVTGDVVTGIVNSHGVTKRVPVVLYSDISPDELAERARRCGASGFIRKTGDEDEFLRRVRDFLPAAAVQKTSP
ncbi:MAG: response regulator [Archangiaceae bacterium]|nr:response regulator [Archangiaceae bacterium]